MAACNQNVISRGSILRCKVAAAIVSKPVKSSQKSRLPTLSDRYAMLASKSSLPGSSFRMSTSRASSVVNHRCHQASMAVDASTTETAPVEGATVEAKPEIRKRVLSGVQPTGDLHLGNYLGAIRNWVDLQEQYDTYFCVVDLHAITVSHNPKDLLNATRTSAATYIASGIDPEKATIFVQSHVRAHTELTWLLNCNTPLGWLQRMIQFKEKAKKQGEEANVGLGLLGYPVLMASDILLYDADLVPVGEDQRQHLELTRDIAGRINDIYGGKKWKKMGGRGGRILKVPEPLIPPAGARVMSLVDGTSKMSKSAEAEGSRINLTDTPDVIARKIKRCKTDQFEGLEFGNPDRPEATNLLTIYQLMTGMTQEEVLAEVSAMRWGDFKPILTDACVAHLSPIQERYNECMADPAYLDSVLRSGADAANEQAERTLFKVKQAMGFMPPL